MNWTRYIPEAAGLAFIFAVIVSTVRGMRPRVEPSAPSHDDEEDEDEDEPEDDEQAECVAMGLEFERYEAIVSELADCPEHWPEWARQHHQAKAAELYTGSNAAAIRGQMLWDAGQELRGMLAVDDANRMRRRALEMLAEAEGQ